MTPALFLGLVAVFVVPLLVRHVRSVEAASKDEHMSPGWLRDNR